MGKSLRPDILTIFVLLIGIVVLSGCAMKTTDPIIGTWQCDNNPGLRLVFTNNNSTAYANGTAQMTWNDNGTITYYGVWRSWGNESYTASFLWLDPEHKNFIWYSSYSDIAIKYDNDKLYTTIDQLSSFHRND
jgi:hypothetical protein